MRSARFRANSPAQTAVSTGGSLGSRAVFPLVLACALGALSVSARTQERRDGPAADNAAPAATVIVQVSIGQEGGLPVVRVDGNGRLTYQLARLNDPDRLVLDFPGARLAAAWPAIPNPLRPVLQVRVGQYKPDVARVVIDLERFGPYRIRAEGSSLIVTFAATPAAPANRPHVLVPPAEREKNALDSPRTDLTPSVPAPRADPPQVSRGPRLLVVDDDLTECPQAEAVNLHDVLKLARAGDTIHVCPGTYAGGVVVDKPRLILIAQGARGAVKIVGAGASRPKFGFTIVADGVQIEGFEISGFAGQHDASGIFVGGLFPGDTAHRANGAVIKRNNVHDNGDGIYLWQSNGNQVLENQLHHNRSHDGHGGIGVLSFAGSDAVQIAAANAAGQSGTRNVISRNTVHGNDRGGIFLGACDNRQTCPGDARAVISGTEVTDNDVYENGAAGPLAGIGLYSASGGAAGVQIADNHTERNHIGILLHRVDHTRVERNRAAENRTGISLVASHANHLIENEAEDNTLFDGILLRSSSDNQVVENQADGNARDGIRVGEDSIGNTFESNVLTDNEEHDVHDQSVGVRTAGRANTWTENQCGKGSVPGLCDDEDQDQSSANLPFILAVSFLLGGLAGRVPSGHARQ